MLKNYKTIFKIKCKNRDKTNARTSVCRGLLTRFDCKFTTKPNIFLQKLSVPKVSFIPTRKPRLRTAEPESAFVGWPV